MSRTTSPKGTRRAKARAPFLTAARAIHRMRREKRAILGRSWVERTDRDASIVTAPPGGGNETDEPGWLREEGHRLRPPRRSQDLLRCRQGGGCRSRTVPLALWSTHVRSQQVKALAKLAGRTVEKG